jgi:hypothetical protein
VDRAPEERAQEEQIADAHADTDDSSECACASAICSSRLCLHARQLSVPLVLFPLAPCPLFTHSLHLQDLCPSPPLRVLCKNIEFLPCITPLHTAHLFSLALVSILCLFSLALLSDMHKCAYITVILFHRRYKQSLALPETKEADITL